MASTLHSVRTMSRTPTRWNAPRCGDARHPPHHAPALRTVTVRGAPGGRSLPSHTGYQGHGAGRLRGGSGVCQGETSKVTPKLVGGQGLLSIRWAGWNPAAHPVKGGASSAPHPMHRHPPYTHRVERTGVAATPTRASGTCGAAHRCGGAVRWECTTSSATAPVHPMHRTTAPDAGMFRTPAPGGAHRVDRSIRTTVASTPSERGAVGSTVSTQPRRRRRRALRHGFGRPPGYCRERRRTDGRGVGAGYSAVRSWLASTRCSRRSRCFGESCIRIRSTTGSSSFTGAVPVLSPRSGVSGAGAPGACRGLARRLRCASRRAVTAGDRGPGRDRAAGAAARAPGGGCRRRGRRARPGASCPRRCGGGRRRRG